jgi:hypothetical protein
MMITAYDEIMQISDDVEWRNAFRFDLEDHLPNLCGVNDALFYASFVRQTRLFLFEEMATKCRNVKAIEDRAPQYPSSERALRE